MDFITLTFIFGALSRCFYAKRHTKYICQNTFLWWTVHSVDLKHFKFTASGRVCVCDLIGRDKHEAKESEMPRLPRVESVCRQTLDRLF